MIGYRTRRSFLALTLIAPIASRAFAQEMPKAETILDRYVEVTGGKAAYEKVKSRVTKAKIELPANGVSGKVTISQDGDKSLVDTDINGVGSMRQGVANGIAWEINPVTGPRLLNGTEKADMARSARLDSEVNWRKIYPKVEATGVEMVDGKPAYKVVLTPTEGSPSTQYYDQKSGLLVRADSKQKSPMGEIAVETYTSDYKKVDGILMPFKSVQKVLSQEFILTIEDVKNNPEIPASTFDVPAEVKKLADKEKPAGDKK